MNLSCSDSHDHLGPMLSNALPLIALADHKARDVLEKQERNFALHAILYKMGALLCAFAKENAVVRQNANLLPEQLREAGHQSGSVIFLKFQKSTAIHYATDEKLRIDLLS